MSAPPDRPWITACATCLALPNRLDLPNEEPATETPGLELVRAEGYDWDRYAHATDMVKRCASCGTYYHHEHSIDREDAFVGGPDITQRLQRMNLVRLPDMLRALGLAERAEAAERRRPALIAHFREAIGHAARPPDNVRPHILESLEDDFIERGDWAALESVLLRHRDPVIALETARDLALVYGEISVGGPYPAFKSYRDTPRSIQERLKPWLAANRALFEERVRPYERSPVYALRYLAENALGNARYYGLVPKS